MLKGDEGVQQRFDTLTRMAWLKDRKRQIFGHLLVGHGFTRKQRLDIFHAQQSEL